MTLHSEIKKAFNSMPKEDTEQKIIPQEARQFMNIPPTPFENRVSVYFIENKNVQLSEIEIPIRIYTPTQKDNYPILMYFHGGAFFSGNLESHDEIARSLSITSGYKVIAVDYRLAPEYPYPAALHDCYDITKWAITQKETLNWDGKNLATAGDSSGGNLVAAVSLLSRQKKEFSITKQVLFYPSLDLDVNETRYPSLIENNKGYGLETAKLAEFNSFYLSNGANPHDPLVSPIKERNLANLPSTFIITAEHDPLRDEGELFAEKLKDANVNIKLKRYDGAVHGFLGKFTHLKEYNDVYQLTGDFLK